MSKFIFYNDNEGRVTKIKFDAAYLPDVIREFESFIVGCGYTLFGHLEIVEEENSKKSKGTK